MRSNRPVRTSRSAALTRLVGAPHNRCATVLELTDAGRALLEELVAHRVEVFRTVAAGMNSCDRGALLRGRWSVHDGVSRPDRPRGKPKRLTSARPPSSQGGSGIGACHLEYDTTTDLDGMICIPLVVATEQRHIYGCGNAVLPLSVHHHCEQVPVEIVHVVVIIG